MLKYTIDEISTGLYKIKDPLDVNFYLIVGDEKALLFDTGYGIVDIPEAVKSITSKPLTVVLGHGHIDHANGAYQFEEVYLRAPDFELFREHTSPQIRSVIIDRVNEAGLKPDFETEKWINNGNCKLKPLEIGTVFDLGGLNVEVIDMAAHTGGSIGLLVIEKRILLDSDSANSHCWMFVPQSLSIREYIAMLKRVKQLEFDVFYVAHQDHPHPKSDFDKYIRVAENATIEKSKKYDAWQEEDPYIYTEGDTSIVFNKRTLAERA
ncbi:MAG: MBL fold metallo-hydrolase [Oscillospiraceae bacterium]|nr:MBL fold metallo-hydrolase [Oscillospiraceae bacterium]